MNLLSIVRNYLNGNSDSKDIPEGYCPNCWGRQEYAGQFFEAIKNEQIDLNNIDEKKGWIDAYATEHFEGIRLKQSGNVYECAACKLTYTIA